MSSARSPPRSARSGAAGAARPRCGRSCCGGSPSECRSARSRWARAARDRERPADQRGPDRRRSARPPGSSATSPGSRVPITVSTIDAERRRPRHLYTRRASRSGSIAALIPWNSPLISLANKVAPGARGRQYRRPQAERVRLGERASSSPALTADILPPGVLNVVSRPRARRRQRRSSRIAGIAKISFTGGPEHGERDPARCRGQLDAQHHGARRQERVDRVRRTPTSTPPSADATDRDLPRERRGLLRVVTSARCRTAVHDEFLARFVEIAERIVVGDAIDRRHADGPA